MATYPFEGVERCMVTDLNTNQRYRIDDAGGTALRAHRISKPLFISDPSARRLEAAACTMVKDPDKARRIADVAFAMREVPTSQYSLATLCSLLCLECDTTAAEIEDVCRNHLGVLSYLVTLPLTFVDGPRADFWQVQVQNPR